MIEKYQEIIKTFIIEYYNDRKRQVENNFMVIIPLEADARIWEKPLQTPFGQELMEIARAAAGLIEDDKEGWNRGVVYEGIQDLMEQLFAPPGLFATYQIPAEFWEHPLGQMVGRAWVWVQQDELITQAQAVELGAPSVQAVNNAIRDGRLRGYKTPEPEHQRQGATLVSKKEVANLWSRT